MLFRVCYFEQSKGFCVVNFFFFSLINSAMADLFSNSSSKASRFERGIWAGKLVLLSIGIISTVILFKVVIIPYTFNLTFSILSSLPSLWISLRIWLSPPYIYIILNFIIITIAASSSFHHQNHHQPTHPSPQKYSNPKFKKNHIIIQEEENPTFSIGKSTDPSTEKFSNPKSKKNHIIEEEEEEENPTFSIGKSADPSHESFSNPTLKKNHIIEEEEGEEKSQISIGKSADPFPEKLSNKQRKISGEKLAISEEEGKQIEDTLEETWKMIREGEGTGRRKQLKKSDTWDTPPRVVQKVGEATGDEEVVDRVAWARRELRKSDTFNDTVSLRREKSMSQEELNRRAEAFIKKINNDLRLQRQESNQRFLEMVNRGV